MNGDTTVGAGIQFSYYSTGHLTICESAKCVKDKGTTFGLHYCTGIVTKTDTVLLALLM